MLTYHIVFLQVCLCKCSLARRVFLQMSNAPEPLRDRDLFGWVVFGGHLRVGMFGSPHWEKAAVPGTPCDISDTFLCSFCNEECEVRSKVPYSAVKLCCRLCRNNSNRQNERCTMDRQLKAWWVQLCDEERERSGSGKTKTSKGSVAAVMRLILTTEAMNKYTRRTSITQTRLCSAG